MAGADDGDTLAYHAAIVAREHPHPNPAVASGRGVITPARIDFDDAGAGAPLAPDYGDVYHPREGALAQASHVFIGGNGLPARWQGRASFAVLETGFGLGNNFLATWGAWRDDARRCERLTFLSIDKHPPAADDLRRAHAASPLHALARELIERWPLPTPNLHRVAFDDGRVELLLLWADIAGAIAEVVGRFDAFYLDGFAPAKNPAMWQPRVLAALGRLAARGATAATWSVAREMRDGLAAAGFAVERAPGFGGRREMTVATFAPRHVARPLPGRGGLATTARDVVIVGAGLAGSAAAAALAERGFDVTVVARNDDDAPASMQRAGLFHGIVHRADGPHARFTRAAALLAQHEFATAFARGVPGRIGGMLRIEGKRLDLDAMRATLAAQALPSGYVAALEAQDASALAGVPVAAPSWHYPGGGWLDPRALCSRWLDDARARRHTGHVAALRRNSDNDERWQLLDAGGSVIAQASIVVIAGGAGAIDLLAPLPLELVRGQTSLVRAGTPGLRAPSLPIADAGYVLPLDDGSVLCGASSSAGDSDAAPRHADRAANLERLERLTGSRIAIDGDLALDDDRAGLRLVAPDRLPLVGALPASAAELDHTTRLDHPRFVPRAPGLFVLGALGSRGITWAPLAARLLAAQITGTPWPLEASLADAIDPARFVARAVRGRGD